MPAAAEPGCVVSHGDNDNIADKSALAPTGGEYVHLPVTGLESAAASAQRFPHGAVC